MEPILFLTHRIPFPPNKGDKVRSFHLLRFLASRYRVHLGTFVDDAADLAYVTELEAYTASSKVAVMRPSLARLRSAAGLWTGEALTLPYYRDAGLSTWIEGVVREQRIAKAVVFSSAMAQYLTGRSEMRVVVDFVDVDSAKWEEYGRSTSWPLNSIYGREGRRLLAFERSVAASVHASVFVTPAEVDLFRRLAPECATRVHCVRNGVDIEYFSPDASRSSPFEPETEAIVFTGAMDYWPNVDAVTWFVGSILPVIAAQRPHARFYIVGMRPTPAVLSLARDPRVTVTGLVPDVRPYLQHACVVVAPLRVARGIQNKVLEGMAMARPVVVSAAAATGLPGRGGIDFEVAAEPSEFARYALAAMEPSRGGDLGRAARACVMATCGWTASLAQFEGLLDAPGDTRAIAG